MVSDFNFDENAKRVSFRVDGENGTAGLIIVVLEKVLQSPYMVSIDGQTTTNFSTIEDKINGENAIQISYHHSAHDIAITGTNVVPEFPLPQVGATGVIVAAVIIIGRLTNIIKKQK